MLAGLFSFVSLGTLPQSAIANPQSPIPNPNMRLSLSFIRLSFFIIGRLRFIFAAVLLIFVVRNRRRSRQAFKLTPELFKLLLIFDRYRRRVDEEKVLVVRFGGV